MTVSFVDVFGNNKEITYEETCYILPYSGKLVIKDVNPDSCVLNHKLIYHDSMFELPVKQDDITLSDGEKTIRIKILKGEVSQESIIDYQDIYKQYLSYVNDDCFDYHALNKAFDINNNDAIRLCSFNKKFSNLLQSNNRDEILKDVKYLPHIFNRPKLHLKQVEEVRPASIVTRIGTESIRHLASHSEHWKGIKVNGLIPERLLARILEDDYAIYENVVAKTVVDRLYVLEKKEKEDTIDCKMNFTLSESYSQGGERQNFFDAINFLFKGFENTESSTTQNLIDETLKIINSILEYLLKCKSTNLYRHIKKEKEIKGTLKKTNIFMMDNYYKKVYHLWEILGKNEEISELLEKKEIKDEYLLYVELIILFCLNYMGFKPEKDIEILLCNNLFDHCIFTFKDWEIILNTERTKIFDGFITAEITQKKKIAVQFTIKLPTDDSVYHQFKATKSGNQILFEKELTKNEQDELCNLLQVYIEKNQQGKWKQDFRKTLHDSMMKVSFKKETLLFIPWKYGIADDYKIAKETLKQIGELIPNGFNECYILNITRPNELRSITDENFLKSLVSYNVRNQDTEKNNEFGIIPVTLNDINSFRRISKIFLKNMITLKTEQNYCPQCGSELRGDKTRGYFCVKQECNFKIYNTQCNDCKKIYWYTNYIMPKVFEFDTELIGLKILLNENKLGFKNITEFISDQKPKCPYCNKGNNLISDGKYSIENYLIKTEKMKNPQKTFVRETHGGVKQIITETKNFNKNESLIQNKNILVKMKNNINYESIKCPCCNKYLNKENYVTHLQAHAYNRSYKIFSKNLSSVETVLCPICFQSFEKTESAVFIQHIANSHPSVYETNFNNDINNRINCKKCGSVLLGVHPAIIIQHLLNGCN